AADAVEDAHGRILPPPSRLLYLEVGDAPRDRHAQDVGVLERVAVRPRDGLGEAPGSSEERVRDAKGDLRRVLPRRGHREGIYIISTLGSRWRASERPDGALLVAGAPASGQRREQAHEVVVAQRPVAPVLHDRDALGSGEAGELAERERDDES